MDISERPDSWNYWSCRTVNRKGKKADKGNNALQSHVENINYLCEWCTQGGYFVKRNLLLSYVLIDSITIKLLLWILMVEVVRNKCDRAKSTEFISHFYLKFFCLENQKSWSECSVTLIAPGDIISTMYRIEFMVIGVLLEICHNDI